MNAYAQSVDTYLVQRVMGASSEQQAALLMEAGQRYIGKGLKALELKDHAEAARCFIRVTDIINESVCRLNYDDGGELVQNLLKVYRWWTQEILEGSKAKDSARLMAVSKHMGEIRQAWEQLHEKKAQAISPSEFLVGNLVG
jgi:flagellar biosynthetic protein FliS